MPYDFGDGFDHSSPANFADALAKVWNRIGERAHPAIRLVIRFGSIGSREVNAADIVRESLNGSAFEWRIVHSRSVGSAQEGKRQADQMIDAGDATEERDYFVRMH